MSFINLNFFFVWLWKCFLILFLIFVTIKEEKNNDTYLSFIFYYYEMMQTFIKKFKKIFMKYLSYNLWIIILQKSKIFFFLCNRKKRLLFQSSFQFHNLIKLEEIRKKRKYITMLYFVYWYIYIYKSISSFFHICNIYIILIISYIIKKYIESNIFCITYFIPNRYIT